MSPPNQPNKPRATNQTLQTASIDPALSCFPLSLYTPRNDDESNNVTSPQPILSFDEEERGLVLRLASPPQQLPRLATLPESTTATITDSEAPFRSTVSPPISLPRSIESTPSVVSSSSTNDEESGLPTSSSTTTACPNEPNQMLETPPLYFIMKRYPRLLDAMDRFYKFRWAVSYPFQRRIQLGIKPSHSVTWGELFLMLPFFAAVIAASVYTFAVPSISATGRWCRIPLIFAFITAMKNSFVTFLLGIPFDRALFYHKLAGRIALFNSILHLVVAFVYPLQQDVGASFWEFLGLNTINTSGTLLLIFMASLIVTSAPIVRQRAYEFFYFLHIVYAAAMIGCAFYHSGILVPILASTCWCVDVIIRKGVMAFGRYPREATIRILSDSIVEIRFPKSQGFDYNPGQYVMIAVPELSIFQWHPFSISSSPCQKTVTLHIRKCGDWTRSLYKLAKRTSKIRILMEGPYGSLGVDLMSNRYKMICLISGGTGVAPMSSICNQLVYNQSNGDEESKIKRLSFVWTERDPSIMNKVEIVRRSSIASVAASSEASRRRNEGDASNLPSPAMLRLTEGESMGIASIMLALVPASSDTDDDDATVQIRNTALPHKHGTHTFDTDDDSPRASSGCGGEEDSTLDKAYGPAAAVSNDFLDLNVFLTSGKIPRDVAILPFVHKGRPNIYRMLRNMRMEALQLGEVRVAVCVCAPVALVKACRQACAKLSSDCKVQFDLHEEIFS